MTPEERARDIARLVESHFYLTSESDEFKAAVANAIREAVREEKVRAARITQKMGRDFANEGEDYVASICASLTSAILNETPEPEETRENIELRALLAHGSDPCIYCGLPAKELSKCVMGFPGCGRADDMLAFNDPWGSSKTPEPAKAGNTAGEPLEGSTGPDVRG